MGRSLRGWVAVTAALAAMGCRDDAAPAPEPRASPAAAPPVASAPPHGSAGSRAPAARVEIRPAPAGGEVAPLVAGELAAARAAGRRLIVYVGATWCEPCRYFHDAAASGALDASFPTLTVLEFDLDRDKERLERAGYGSRMIPLFAAPRDDGSASDRRMEGSIKGPGAVAEITPRLEQLLAGGR